MENFWNECGIGGRTVEYIQEVKDFIFKILSLPLPDCLALKESHNISWPKSPQLFKFEFPNLTPRSHQGTGLSVNKHLWASSWKHVINVDSWNCSFHSQHSDWIVLKICTGMWILNRKTWAFSNSLTIHDIEKYLLSFCLDASSPI